MSVIDRVVSIAEMRDLERRAMQAGVSEDALQRHAAQALALEVLRLLGDEAGPVLALVGAGNNGRDAALALLLLARAGRAVVLGLGPRHALTQDELWQFRSLGATVLELVPLERLRPALVEAAVAIDGLVGIGARGPLRAPMDAVAEALNQARQERHGALRVLAVDLPSGIDADTGAVPGAAVQADITVTLGAVKQGLLSFPAMEHVGRLVRRDIGIPPESGQDLPYRQLAPEDLEDLLPARPLSANKYSFGRVLVVAGSDHFPGAALLCATAAARAGAGLVTMASGPVVRSALAGFCPEVTYTTSPVDLAGDPPAAVELLDPYLRSHNVLVIGPGVGREPATLRAVELILRRRREAAREGYVEVLDADALFALAAWSDWPRFVGPNAILTPHAGELARLVAARAHQSAAHPWAQATGLARRWGVTLVAKGPVTTIAAPDGTAWIWSLPNPALASGGTGDVLAGLCAGLAAQGLAAPTAAALAVGVHGQAAAQVVASRGWRSLLASDLLQEAPGVLGRLASGAGRPAPEAATQAASALIGAGGA